MDHSDNKILVFEYMADVVLLGAAEIRNAPKRFFDYLLTRPKKVMIKCRNYPIKDRLVYDAGLFSD